MSNPFRSTRLFCVLLSVLLGMALIEAGWLVRQRALMKQARTTLEARERELDSLPGVPAGGGSGVDALPAAHERAGQELEALRLAYQPSGDSRECCDAHQPEPEDRAEAYFRLLQLREHLRTAAEEARVDVRPTEAFAFASHAHSGPGAEQIRETHRQAQAVARTLHALFRARPHRLQSIARERPAPTRPAAGNPSGETDFFVAAERLGAKRPDLVEAIALRVSFVGQTGALRAFLRELSRASPPVHICSVEVEPASEGPEPEASIDHATLTPLVTTTLSQFTVTLEWLELREVASARRGAREASRATLR